MLAIAADDGRLGHQIDSQTGISHAGFRGVVSCLAGCAEAVSSRISAFDGVEVHGVLPDGRIIAVIEADTVDAEVGLVSQLHEVEDVVAVQLAYHNFEDL